LHILYTLLERSPPESYQMPNQHVSTNYTCKESGVTAWINSNILLLLEALEVNVTKVYTAFSWLKKDTLSCDMWLASLVGAQANHAQVSKLSIWKQVQAIEQACKMACMVKAALVEVHQSSSLAMGNWTFKWSWGMSDIFTQRWTCLAEAGRCFTHAHLTPCLTNPLLHLFRKWANHPLL